jgi:class 3 adenylate cyclase/predicted ATPase
LPLSPQSQAIWWQTAVSDGQVIVAEPGSASLGHPASPDSQVQPTPRPAFGPATQTPVPIPNIDRFLPRALADKLENARASGSMVGERRVLTMLFCDVQGSTAAAEKLDPEEWTDIINGAFEHMIKPVYKYEGIVARLMGDAILAFFGAPIAHEDDPQRAILTGLDIVEGFKVYQEQTLEQYGFKITLRVGINTGLVVVGAVGSDLRMEYTAMGDAINLAARMEQTAEPGTVQIAEPTYRLVSPVFELEPLGPVEVKGKEKPVAAYRVLGRKAVRNNLRGIEGMRSTLIGRDRELNTIHGILNKTQQGLGHIICLTGEAGLGKSRLVEEAHNYWQSTSWSGNWQGVSSFSYETNHAFGLFQRLIRRLNNIGITDSPAMLRQKLEPLLTIFPQARHSRIMQIFETVFALESDSNMPRLVGESFRQELFNVMLQIWSHRFADQPNVLAFDDLHWSDPASVQLLTYLFAVTDTIPLVLICAFRSDRDAPSALLQSTASQKFSHRYTEIRLSTLPDEDISAILDELLAIGDLPDQLRQDILDRASGNPFFVEEVVRSLVLSGVVVAEDVQVDDEMQQVWRAVDSATFTSIPNNLQGLLAARIDRLEESVRASLQLASVIGRSFYERVLTEVAALANGDSAHTTQHLRRLLQMQIIQEASRIPEVEYIFRNPLTQEVAYNGILLKRRREFHERVGLAMETLFSEQLTEISPRLAFHFQEARHRKKAFHYYVMAADQARLVYAHQEALTHYDRALSLVDNAQPSSDQLIQLYLDRGRTLEHGGKFVEALENYETLSNLAINQGNKEMRLQALIASGTVHSMQTPLHDPEKAQQLAEDGLVLTQELDNKAAEAKIQWNLMQMARFRGQEGDEKLAISHGERSLRLARDLDLRSQMALTLNDLSAIYRYANQTDKANETAKEARVLLREIGNLPMLADSFSQSAHFLCLSGEFDEAKEAATEAKRISTEIGNLWNLGASAFALGLIELERGHLGAALSIFSTAENLAGIAHLDFIITVLYLRLIELFIEAGALEKAQEYVEKSLITAHNVPFMTQLVRALQARIQLLKDPDQAQKVELDMAPSTKTESLLRAYYMMFEWQYQIELALAKEKTTYAIQRAKDSIASAERFDVGIFLPVFRLLLARGLWQQGVQAAAQEALAIAETKAREIGSKRSLWLILAQKAKWETDDAAATEVRAEARTMINYIANNAGTSELKQSFLNRPQVKELNP